MNNDISFEAALAELEAAVKKLEGGALTLDESLAVFERAIALAKSCNEKLEAAEQRVRILTEGEDGAVTDAPFANINNEA